jgi:hypothetical protein
MLITIVQELSAEASSYVRISIAPPTQRTAYAATIGTTMMAATIANVRPGCRWTADALSSPSLVIASLSTWSAYRPHAPQIRRSGLLPLHTV